MWTHVACGCHVSAVSPSQEFFFSLSLSFIFLAVWQSTTSFQRVILKLGPSDVSSWPDSGHTFLAEILQKCEAWHQGHRTIDEFKGLFYPRNLMRNCSHCSLIDFSWTKCPIDYWTLEGEKVTNEIFQHGSSYISFSSKFSLINERVIICKKLLALKIVFL